MTLAGDNNLTTTNFIMCSCHLSFRDKETKLDLKHLYCKVGQKQVTQQLQAVLNLV